MTIIEAFFWVIITSLVVLLICYLAITFVKTDVEEVTFDEDTLNKVYMVMSNQGLTLDQATDLVNAFLNEGLLFRERIKED